MIALIPGRLGSKRIPRKNLKRLNGHPLIAYAIAAAKQAESVTDVVVSTESEEVRDIAKSYGVRVLMHQSHHDDFNMDINWMRHAVCDVVDDHYAIVRCTSPFRTGRDIDSAYEKFLRCACDSLRAVELVSQHPGKMWHLLSATRMVPLHPSWMGWNSPTQSLPPIYVQNASLEIVTRRAILKHGILSGFDVCPYVMPPPEGFDLNTEDDWTHAEAMVKAGAWVLPALDDN